MLVISLPSIRPACKQGTLRVDHVSPLPATDRALEELIETLDMSHVQRSVKFMLVRREEVCSFTSRHMAQLVRSWQRRSYCFFFRTSVPSVATTAIFFAPCRDR